MIRISTGMIYDAGVKAINAQSAAALKIQQQVAAGRRILTPSDDPVNAARALVVSQAADVVDQFSTNQDNAKSALGMEDTQLMNASSVLGGIRDLAVKAQNGALSSSDRKSIATELRSRFDQLLGIANSTDGTGQYLFSGYMGDTKPFDGTVAGAVNYSGDEGQRRLQVSASRQLEISDSGRDVFERIDNGNGTFATGYGSNSGTGVIDGGTVTNPASWVAPTSGSYTIQFNVSGGVTTYQIYDGATALLATPGTYTSGQPISLQKTTAPAVNFGAQVSLTGVPANGDTFAMTPSSSQSVFATISKLVNALETAPTTAAGQAAFQMDVMGALGGIDRASDNIMRVDASVGARLSEIDSLSSTNSDLALQYKQTLSNLQDVDMTKALSDMTRLQTQLEAAQKSFVATSKLSLFSYL
jgi:flagellar hook-associated protein 3 FlgL